MPHKPDYESPWGKPQTAEEMAQIHARWSKNLKTVAGRMTPPTDIEGEDWELAQCGCCSYFIPLEGSIGADWGVCSSKYSIYEREAVFEHFGCVRHSEANKIVGRDGSRGA